MSAASDVRFPGGFFTWQTPDNFGENLQSGWESWELPCRRLGAAATASSPSHGFYCFGYCEGREGGEDSERRGGEEEKEPHNFACIPPTAPRPCSAPALPSLHNALAGGALPGLLPCCRRRAPGTPAAGRRRRLRVRPGVLRGGARRGGGKGKPMPLLQMPAHSSRHAAPSPFERTAWKSHPGKYLGEAFLSGGFFKSGGKDLFKEDKKQVVWVFRVAGRKVARGTTVFTEKRKTPDRQGQPKGSAPAAVPGLPVGERSRPRPRRLQRGSDRAATRGLQLIPALALAAGAGRGCTRGRFGAGEAAGSCSGAGTGRAGERGREG